MTTRRHQSDSGPLWKRLTWFIAIWFMSVAALVAVAFVLRQVAV
jgi:hypothetical protein